MDNKEKIALAKRTIADKWKCGPAVFDMDKNVFLASSDTFFEIVTFGTNAVIRADEAMLDWCVQKFKAEPARDIMDGDNLFELDIKLRSHGKRLGGEHIRYLHMFPERGAARPQGFTYRLFAGEEIRELQGRDDCRPFNNAFAPDMERNMLAIAAYDGETVAAVAGSDDYDNPLWQIGVDTAAGYRNRGLGAYLVKEITLESEKRGKVTFYNTWSPNLASTKVALSTGYYPVWMGYPSIDAPIGPNSPS